MSWTFRLNITNDTDRVLVVSDPDLRWGVWWTGNNGGKPVDVPPGKTVHALGVSSWSTYWPSGYSFSCTWLDSKDDTYGAISIDVSVPWRTSANVGKLTTSGLLDQEGWEDLEASGTSFTRNIVVWQMGDELRIDEAKALGYTPGFEDEPLEEADPDYRTLYDFEVASNEMMRDWRELEKSLKEVDQFLPRKEIPGEYPHPPKEKFIGRGEILEFDRNEWKGIGDRDLTTEYAKGKYAERYFAVPVYSMHHDPFANEALPAGHSKRKMRSSEVTSTLRSTLEQTWSIKMSMEYSRKTKVSEAVSAKVAGRLESKYSIKGVREESTSRVDKEEEEINIEAADHDRLFVSWVFLTALAIYCERKSGEFRLVAISQWATLQYPWTYRDPPEGVQRSPAA